MRTACHRLLVDTLTTGAVGGVGLPADPGDAELVGVALIVAAASRAAAASAVPAPDPSFCPPGWWNAVLLVRACSTWAGVSVGNCDRMRAAMPATTALAALVLFSLAYPVGPLAAMTPLPAAVSVAYAWWLVNGALMKPWPNAPTEITPG